MVQLIHTRGIMRSHLPHRPKPPPCATRFPPSTVQHAAAGTTERDTGHSTGAPTPTRNAQSTIQSMRPATIPQHATATGHHHCTTHWTHTSFDRLVSTHSTELPSFRSLRPHCGSNGQPARVGRLSGAPFRRDGWSLSERLRQDTHLDAAKPIGAVRSWAVYVPDLRGCVGSKAITTRPLHLTRNAGFAPARVCSDSKVATFGSRQTQLCTSAATE
jgi:hypothetical protein